MAILLRGKTECPICGKTIEEGESATLFPHFVLNEDDALHPFSDGAYHAACLEEHPLGKAMEAAYEAYAAHTGPGRRPCAVCKREIDDPDDDLLIAYLGDPSESDLGRFNFTHLHKSHIGAWREAESFLALAKQTLATGRWKGASLLNLVQIVENSRDPSRAQLSVGW